MTSWISWSYSGAGGRLHLWGVWPWGHMARGVPFFLTPDEGEAVHVARLMNHLHP